MTQIAPPVPLATKLSLELEQPAAPYEGDGDTDTLELAPLPVRLATLVSILLPFAGLIIAVVLLWGVAFNWVYLAMFLGGYLLTGLGITVGFHRYFTHKSFEAPRAVQATLGALGSMAVEGPLLTWAATHRLHHQHSDRDADPHSPHTHGEGFTGFIKGLVHSHFGWLFMKEPENLAKYAPDLAKDPLVRFFDRTFVWWMLLGLVLPAVVGGLVTMSWSGVGLGFLWGGLARVFFVHHVTWSVNSVCHLWGSRPFRSHDHSRNNALFGILAFGEGWHNNHHAFPASARHGLRAWQFDLSYLVIRALGLVGLAWDIRVPTADRQKAKLRAERAE